MGKRLKLIGGCLFFALMFVHAAASIHQEWREKRSLSNRGWEASEKDGKAIIFHVDQSGPASGLRVGDEMVEVKGVPRDNFPLLNRNEALLPPGTPYTLVIRRDGLTQEFALMTMGESWVEWLSDLTVLFSNFIFILTGLIVFLLKPENKQAVLLALMLGTFSGLVQAGNLKMPAAVLAIVLLARMVGTFFFPLFVHFFLLFPEPLPWLRRFPRLELWIYLPYALTVLPLLGAINTALFFNRMDWLEHAPRGSSLTVNGMMVCYLSAGLSALAFNYRAANEQARRRLRVVLAGAGIGFLNLLLIFLFSLSGLEKRVPKLGDYLVLPLAVTMPLIPLSFAYAIIRHQVIPVSLILRRGVRYVLVSRGSVLMEGIAVTVSVTALLTYVFSRFNPPGIIIGLVSAVVAIATWKLEGWWHNKYLAPLIDRKFFRQAYDSQKIMSELADSLRSTTDLPHLCKQVATKIQTALQTESVSVLLRDEATGDYLSGYSCEYSGNGKSTSCQKQFRLPAQAGFVAELKETGQPVEIESRLNGKRDMSEDAELREMKSSLLLPLMAKDGMAGIISLGPRLGDLPFSREDKHLLTSVAGPTAFAIENSRLVERMIAEARRREEIEAENEQRAKELEEARQLQLSMLPKTVPQLPHLEIAAYMQTATEVGGDYYDFRVSDNGDLTIVVGDATGHGLKAGTVVTATKSLFNHLAETPDVTEFFHHSSRALKLMNMRSLFMAMTVARIKGYELTLSSAGMPATLIYRAGTGGIEEVPLTGIPLGSMSGYRYRQQQVPLHRGDVVVLMSDGFPERFNHEDEMLDYDRVKELLVEAAKQSPQEIIQRFIRAGDNWANGRPQDDDVTFVVLKVK